MQLGIGSFAYAWAIGVPGFKPSRPMTAPHLVTRAASLGVQLVQIADNLPLDRLTEAELRDLKAQADALGVKVEVGTRGIAPSHLATYLELAEFFASPVIRVVVDTAHHHPDEDEVVGTLGPLMKAFERARVQLAIENHDRFSAETLARIVARLGSPYAGICLDVINSIGALEGPKEVVDALAPLAVSLHVKDVVAGRINYTMGFAVEGRPVGQGQLDIPWLLKEVEARGRNPNVILELWPPKEPELTDTIAQEDAWVASSVSYLRGLIPRQERVNT